MDRSLKLHTAVGLAMAALSVGVIATAMVLQPLASESAVKKSIARHFPNSTISSVKCGTVFPGLCEVVIGPNVLYASRDARKVFVGSILDLEARKDLTDQRLKELAAVDAATTRIGGSAQPQQKSAQGAPGGKIKVDLPRDNAVVHNSGAPVKVTVFADYSCGYCHQLFADLAGKTNIEITEYPIAILGPQSMEKARLVLCATDRVKAAAAAYAGEDIKTSADCSRFSKAVEQNTAFASANGINGTPAIIRTDGTVNAGYLPFADLMKFLEAK